MLMWDSNLGSPYKENQTISLNYKAPDNSVLYIWSFKWIRKIEVHEHILAHMYP